MNQNEPKWSNATHNQQSDSRPIVLYYAHIQAGFDNPFINGRGFIYLDFLEKISTL